MESSPSTIVSTKFKILRTSAANIFNSSELKYKFNREDYFVYHFNSFYNSLEKEIMSLPRCPEINQEIDTWVRYLDTKIEAASKSEIASIFKKYRRKLKTKLLEIQLGLLTNKEPVQAEVKEEPTGALTFKDIFVNGHWQNYIDALSKVDNPVISSDYKFIGKDKKHKGVICSWIKELQVKGIIKGTYSRQELATILNHEIVDLNLGKDGKTFDNYSLAYDNLYKSSLLRLVNLSP